MPIAWRLRKNSMDNVVKFKIERPSSILPHINQCKGWKFKEEDRDFLVQFYRNWISALKEDADGDFIEQPEITLNSITENGVEESKDLIQMDAIMLAESVNYNIYEFYSNYAETLEFIEKSILCIRW